MKSELKGGKNKAGKIAGFVIFLVLCGVIGFLLGKMGLGTTKSASKAPMAAILILFVPAFFIVIGIHEAGHALAGTLMKFDFRMFVVGPFMWEKEQQGWRFKWNKNVNTAGGLVICLPTTTENLRKRFAIYAAGGPVLSLILTVACTGFYFLLRSSVQDPTTLSRIISAFLILLAAMSAMIFIVTVIPMQNGGFATDGARVFRLLNGGDRGKFEVLVLNIIATSFSGTRPKLYDIEQLNEGLRLAKKLNAHFSVYLHSFLHSAEFDLRNMEKAEHHLNDYIAEAGKIPDGVRSAVWLQAAFFHAYVKGDLEKADYYMAMFKPSAIIPGAQVYATEAAFAYLRKDNHFMLLKIDRALAEIPNMMDKGTAVMLREQMVELRQKISV